MDIDGKAKRLRHLDETPEGSRLVVIVLPSLNLLRFDTDSLSELLVRQSLRYPGADEKRRKIL
jgi:hypothetical protein